MTHIASVSVPSNIAFVKYWGAADLDAVVPANASVSMTLSVCRTHTTAEHGIDHAEDEIFVIAPGGQLDPATTGFRAGAVRHLDRIRERTGIDGRFRIATFNTFPSDAGLASSASGFAALAFAATQAAGVEESPRELSRLARLSGSGSATRSLWGGYVEWPGAKSATGDAAQIAGPDHWVLCDVIAIVEEGPKPASSRDGHRRAPTSPHFVTRQTLLPERLRVVRRAIDDRSLERLGPVLEEEAIELHMIAMTSESPIFYWKPATLAILAAVRMLRAVGVSAWTTMDAGANVHVICEPEHEEAVASALAAVPGVHRVIRDRVGAGPTLETEHLL